jgi:hypothetical protein
MGKFGSGKMCFILGIFEVRVSIITEIQRILLIFSAIDITFVQTQVCGVLCKDENRKFVIPAV